MDKNLNAVFLLEINALKVSNIHHYKHNPGCSKISEYLWFNSSDQRLERA